MRIAWEHAPTDKDPLVHGCETDVPDCVRALAVKGDPAGNDVAPGINVAVCANPSLL